MVLEGYRLFPTGPPFPTLSLPTTSQICIISLIFKGQEFVTLLWFNLTPSMQNQGNTQKVHPSSWSVLVATLGSSDLLALTSMLSSGPLHHHAMGSFIRNKPEPAFECSQQLVLRRKKHSKHTLALPLLPPNWRTPRVINSFQNMSSKSTA